MSATLKVYAEGDGGSGGTEIWSYVEERAYCWHLVAGNELPSLSFGVYFLLFTGKTEFSGSCVPPFVSKTAEQGMGDELDPIKRYHNLIPLIFSEAVSACRGERHNQNYFDLTCAVFRLSRVYNQRLN